MGLVDFTAVLAFLFVALTLAAGVRELVVPVECADAP